MKTTIKNIGIKVSQPNIASSRDKHDPFFGNLKVRGKVFVGKVISAKAHRTAKIEFIRLFPLKKYERFEKRRTRLMVHNPDSINAKEGDIVRVMECRPISKTKNFVIIEKVKNESDSSKNN